MVGKKIKKADAKLRPKFKWTDQLGPGLITGVSDDDPSGIATYSQTGAQFGYQMLWTMFFSMPLMISVQMMCAEIGRVTGFGLAYNVKKHVGVKLLYILIFLLFIANTINIGADILAMGEALKLLIGGSSLLFCFIFGSVSMVFQVFVPYTIYVKYLRILTVSLLAYVATTLSLHIDWRAALTATLVPHFQLNSSTFQALTAILGTTISPYLFFWQASEEVEDERAHSDEKPLLQQPKEAPHQLSRIKWDTIIGMSASNLIAFFIILTTASTLHANGKFNIDTAAQAAEAIRPFAGQFTFFLFSLGIIGTGLLAVPVLAGSTAYAIGETLDWTVGLENKPLAAKYFYGVIVMSTLAGIGLCFIHINPIKALVGAAILNGVIAVPMIAVITFMVSQKKIMGRFIPSLFLRCLGWVTCVVMFATTAGMFLLGK